MANSYTDLTATKVYFIKWSLLHCAVYRYQNKIDSL